MKTEFGCEKSPLDVQDYLMGKYLAPAAPLPRKYNIPEKPTPVRSQMKEGACVGFALAVGVKEYQEQIDYKRFVALSPRYIYEEAKKISGHKSGTTLKAAMQVVKSKGVCEEMYWPYRVPQVISKDSKADENAAKYKVRTYARITNLRQLKGSLVQFGPILIGVKVYKSIHNIKSDGIVPTPNKMWPSNWKPIGGHAVCVVGYDDDRQLIKFKNSWGPEWGEKGYGYFSYKYLQSNLMDAFSSVDIDDPKPYTVGELLHSGRYEKAWI